MLVYLAHLQRWQHISRLEYFDLGFSPHTKRCRYTEAEQVRRPFVQAVTGKRDD